MNEDELGHSKWRGIEFTSVTALVATLICLFVGQTVQQFAAQVTEPVVGTAKLRPRFNAIDYAATASINGATVIIGPCDTHAP